MRGTGFATACGDERQSIATAASWLWRCASSDGLPSRRWRCARPGCARTGACRCRQCWRRNRGNRSARAGARRGSRLRLGCRSAQAVGHRGDTCCRASRPADRRLSDPSSSSCRPAAWAPSRVATAYWTVGSACSGRPAASRFRYTLAMVGRSDGCLASRSTIEASVTTCAGVSEVALAPRIAPPRRCWNMRTINSAARVPGHRCRHLVGLGKQVALEPGGGSVAQHVHTRHRRRRADRRRNSSRDATPVASSRSAICSVRQPSGIVATSPRLTWPLASTWTISVRRHRAAQLVVASGETGAHAGLFDGDTKDEPRTNQAALLQVGADVGGGGAGRDRHRPACACRSGRSPPSGPRHVAEQRRRVTQHEVADAAPAPIDEQGEEDNERAGLPQTALARGSRYS